MHLQSIVKSSNFQQIAPLVVLFVIPTFVFFVSQFLRRLHPLRFFYDWYKSLRMGLDSLGFSWLWSGSSSSSSSSNNKRRKRKTSGSHSKSKMVRTRAEQIAMNNMKDQKQDSDLDSDDGQYYAGLVNISGTYCFMNSTLQARNFALASLSYLEPYIDSIHQKAETFDVPTPVIDALHELFHDLNTPKSSYHSLRPLTIINALSTPPSQLISNGSPAFRSTSSLFESREHQDAQELFQLVTERIKNEMSAVDRESLRDRGMAGVLDLAKPVKTGENDDPKSNNKSVFDGLTANRRSCVICGYTEAVMHFGFDNWQLAVPRLATSCRLEDCLEDYTRLEILKDCICRNCSVVATHKRLLQELQLLKDAVESPAPTPTAMPSSSPTKNKPSQSKKKRLKEVKRMEQRIKKVITDGRIEEDALLEGIRLEKVFSPASTKQAMIARPPPVLALHLNRSVHYGQYAAKNTIRILFPEILDLTPYTTSGSLSTVPTSAISTPSPPPTPHRYQPSIPQVQSSSSSDVSSSNSSAPVIPPKRVRTPTPETYAPGVNRTIYRLSAVVCHYGQHSFGHYICFRRKPRRTGGKWLPPTLIDPLRLELEDEDVQDKEKGKGKPNGSAIPLSRPDYSGSSSLGETRYYWEDRTEEDAGTGKGWLRISDDSVSECGIESVLAEGSGAFMLYYEKAIHPRPGIYLHPRGGWDGKKTEAGQKKGGVEMARARSNWTGSERDGDSVADPDGDTFSIGSEETLKPEMTVVDLNGSIGSLISEVGVGVMKQKKDKENKKEKEKDKSKVERKDSMSMSVILPDTATSSSLSSKVFGPRIVRSVNARRRHTPEGSNSSSSASSAAGTRESSVVSSTADGAPLANGSAIHDDDALDDATLAEMTASAPSILSTTTSSSSTPTKKRSPLALGSKTTMVLNPPSSAHGVKVNVR